MYLSILLEHRFLRTPDGKIWTQMTLPYSAWQPYLAVFEGINVVARMEEVASVSGDMKLSSGPGVSFTAIPYFVGPRQFLLKSGEIRRAMKQALDNDSAVLIRIPGTLGTVAYRILKAKGQPYAAQIVGDPYDIFAPGAISHPLRPLFRWWFTRQLRMQAKYAVAISYVTRTTLQKRYPSQAKFANSFSNVRLPETAFVSKPRVDWDDLGTVERPCNLILVGTLTQLYKSPDVLLRSIALCIARNIHIQLTIVGDGKYRVELEALTDELKLKDYVTFAGQLASGDAVKEKLDQADIFVLPSRTEGLPRAMIEAMARGMPCIGSTMGGIPELLPAEDLVQPGDAQALAKKLMEVITSPQRLQEMSRRNLELAYGYADGILEQERRAFYEYLLTETAKEHAEKQK